MQKNSIILSELTPDDLTSLFSGILRTQLDEFKKEFQNQSANDDLMSRKDLLDFLQINASTLHHWQNKGKITAYKFANKCYYKRSEIMASITPLKK
jgi:hypothetical protein